MRTYTTQSGDTFEVVSRVAYGTPADAKRIRDANPGIAEPLPVGVELLIPAKVQDLQPVITQGLEDISLRVNGRSLLGWETINFTRSMDKISTLGLTAPMEVDNRVFRENFAPFSYAPVLLDLGRDRAFSGTMIKVNPSVSPQEALVNVGCYGQAGVLNDCTMPASAFPLEFNGLTLREIAENVSAPFGIGVNFIDSPGDSFERVALKPEDKIAPWLAQLTKQRELLMRDNANGNLVFHNGKAGDVQAILEEGFSPLHKVTPAFNEQNYYSSITGIEPYFYGRKSPQYTEKNNFLSGVIRPFTFKAEDSETGTIQVSTRSKIGRMFANAIAYNVEVTTWRNEKGELWIPGETIMLRAPKAMIYNRYEFMVRSVKFIRLPEVEKAVLKVILPNVFTNEVPEVLPWSA